MMNALIPDCCEQCEGKYPDGSYVVPNSNNVPGRIGKPAQVLACCNGCFYILDFGDGKGSCKWFCEDELEPVKNMGNLVTMNSQMN